MQILLRFSGIAPRRFKRLNLYFFGIGLFDSSPFIPFFAFGFFAFHGSFHVFTANFIDFLQGHVGRTGSFAAGAKSEHSDQKKKKKIAFHVNKLVAFTDKRKAVIQSFGMIRRGTTNLQEGQKRKKRNVICLAYFERGSQ
jgi:hypothetical protein